MALNIQYGNILNFKGDAIINSLGTNTTEYGKLCQSIIVSAHNEEYVSELNKLNGKVKILDCFVSDIKYFGFTHIINIVTPYAKNDFDYMHYCTAYKRIFNTARNNKLYRIAVALIGTGPNGYPYSMADTIVKSMAQAYCDIYKEMDITIYHLSSYHPKETTLDRTLEEENALKDWICEKKNGKRNFIKTFNYTFDKAFFESPKDNLPPNSIDISEKLREIELKEFHAPVEIYLEYDSQVMDYINLYLKERYKNKKSIAAAKEDLKRFLGDNVFKHLYSRKPNSKSKLLKIAIALKMNYKECEDFLSYFDFSIRKMNRTELLLFAFITERYYDLMEIQSKLIELRID